jgi:HPt (histidine-containing phosphotransfer) domain-containing protein
MTAHAMAGDHEKSLAAGMNDHITKPIDPDNLFGTLSTWIQSPQGKTRNRPAAPEERTPTLNGNRTPAFEKTASPVGDGQLPDRLPGFDLPTGLHRLGGKRELYVRLLVKFATEYEGAVDSFQAVLDAGDVDGAQRLIHTIKGVAGNLAADELQAAAAELEGLLKSAHRAEDLSTQDVDDALHPFQHALDRAVAAIQSTLPAGTAEKVIAGAEPAEKVPAKLAREAADRLKEAADMGDVDELIAIADDISARSPTFDSHRQQIVQLADDFDFEGIAKLAEALENDNQGA